MSALPSVDRSGEVLVEDTCLTLVKPSPSLLLLLSSLLSSKLAVGAVGVECSDWSSLLSLRTECSAPSSDKSPASSEDSVLLLGSVDKKKD